MPIARLFVLAIFAAVTASCATTPRPSALSATNHTAGSVAQVYYWRARPGKLQEYNRYIVDVAEKIDAEAQRVGAFISVYTMIVSDTTLPWTHMRVFILRDSTQLAGLSAALDAAGLRFEPDSVKRRERSTYSATLRDRVGSGVYPILRE